MSNAQSFLDLVANRWPLLVTALVACFVATVAPRLVNVLRLWSIPTIGEELGNTEKRRQAYLGGARKLYSAGYQKVRTPFVRGKGKAHRLAVQRWRFSDNHIAKYVSVN